MQMIEWLKIILQVKVILLYPIGRYLRGSANSKKPELTDMRYLFVQVMMIIMSDNSNENN